MIQFTFMLKSSYNIFYFYLKLIRNYIFKIHFYSMINFNCLFTRFMVTCQLFIQWKITSHICNSSSSYHRNVTYLINSGAGVRVGNVMNHTFSNLSNPRAISSQYLIWTWCVISGIVRGRTLLGEMGEVLKGERRESCRDSGNTSTNLWTLFHYAVRYTMRIYVMYMSYRYGLWCLHMLINCLD